MKQNPNVKSYRFLATIALTCLVSLTVSFSAFSQTRSTNEPPAIEFTVKKGDAETKVKMFVERGVITRVVATNAAGSRTIPRARAGAKIALPCSDENKICETITLESGKVIKVCICKQDATALLLPAVQKVRDFAGGGACTAAHPCCWEDHELQMSICYP